MICKQCAAAADDVDKSIERPSHCKDEACACQHRTGLKREEYLNG